VCTADKRLLQVDNVDKQSEHVWYIKSTCTLQTMHLLRKHSVKYTTLFRLATTLVDFTADGLLSMTTHAPIHLGGKSKCNAASP
jgi:hypothetical protein